MWYCIWLCSNAVQGQLSWSVLVNQNVALRLIVHPRDFLGIFEGGGTSIGKHAVYYTLLMYKAMSVFLSITKLLWKFVNMLTLTWSDVDICKCTCICSRVYLRGGGRGCFRLPPQICVWPILKFATMHLPPLEQDPEINPAQHAKFEGGRQPCETLWTRLSIAYNAYFTVYLIFSMTCLALCSAKGLCNV